MCAPDIPEPDPLIGEAARSNADVAKEQIALGREQLAWERARAEKQDPLIEKVVNQQLASGDVNTARADEQWKIYQNLFKPVEERMVNEAMSFDSPERKERMAAEAGADVTRSFGAAADSNARAMASMGINPNSGRFAGLANENAIAQAANTAGAMNRARRDTELQGIALRTGAAQFGRNMPNTGIAADSVALNAGSNAVGNLAAGSQIHNANQAAAMQWFGGATNANNSAGSLMNNVFGNQISGQNAAAAQAGGAASGLGSLAGTLGSAAIFASF